jgi:hypothetical protein
MVWMGKLIDKKNQDQNKKPPRDPKKKGRFSPFRAFLRLLTNKVFWILLIAALLIFAGVRLFTPFLGSALLGNISLFSNEKSMTADGLLEEVRSLDELAVVQYLHKTVFPYDFFTPGVTIQHITDTLRTDRSGRTIREILTPDEWQTLEAYNLARLTGFDPGISSRPFLVVTLVFRYGYQLNQPGTIKIDQDNADPEKPVWIIRCAPPELLSLEIEDPSRSTYPYPDVDLGIQQWRQISEFISIRSQSLPDEEQIYESAQKSLEQLFSGILPSNIDFQVVMDTP